MATSAEYKWNIIEWDIKPQTNKKGAIAHHPALTVDDLRKLCSHEFVLNVNVPQGLLNKVVFEVMFYFCRKV